MKSKILEYMWLVISIVSLITSLDAYSKQGYSKDFTLFLGVAALAFFMYFFRKKQRMNNSQH